jgi:hypothetical protein
VAQLDRAQLLAVMAAGQALDDSRLSDGEGPAVGVFIGATTGLEAALLRNFRIQLPEYLTALQHVPSFAELDGATRDRMVATLTREVRRTPETREDSLPATWTASSPAGSATSSIYKAPASSSTTTPVPSARHWTSPSAT